MRQGVLRASNRPSGGWGPATGDTNRGDPVGSWSLDGLSVEVVTSETGALEEALKRRTRRTHCGWPYDTPAGAECYLSILPFDCACIQHGWTEGSQAGYRSRRRDTVRQKGSRSAGR